LTKKADFNKYGSPKMDDKIPSSEAKSQKLWILNFFYLSVEQQANELYKQCGSSIVDLS
jgi:hypothetical protein